jgi:N utilization substance protein B
MQDAADTRHQSRELAFEFLYQSELDRRSFFSKTHFDSFSRHKEAASRIQRRAEELVVGVFDQIHEIDQDLNQAMENWRIDRLAATDRAILRLAAYELLESKTPTKVVLDEAIEIAKKYGTENSGQFVNGVLDRIASKK